MSPRRRAGGRWWVAVTVVVVLYLGSSLGGPVPSSSLRWAVSGPAATIGWINVSAAGDYAYQPDTFEQVPTNATIVVTFTDDDPSGMQHSFNLSSAEGVVIPTSYTAAELNHFFGLHPALVALLVNTTGDVAVKSFHSPAAPGWYEFVCNVSGHFQNGMYGFVAFGMNLPSNISSPSRVGVGGGLSFSAIDAAVLGVVVLAFLLGYVLWWRPRSARRRPPGPTGPSRNA